MQRPTGENARLSSNPDHPVLISGQPVPRNPVASVTCTDVEAGWDRRGRLKLGVRTVLGCNPRLANSTLAHSFFPDYDLPGRFLYVKLPAEVLTWRNARPRGPRCSATLLYFAAFE